MELDREQPGDKKQPTDEMPEVARYDSSARRIWELERTLEGLELRYKLACDGRRIAEARVAELEATEPPSSTACKPQGTYVPLTEEEIEQRRGQLLEAHKEPWASGTRRAVNALCDMAISSLLYAQEIDRLRALPSATALSRNDVLEEAALVCEACDPMTGGPESWEECAEAIRALKTR